MSTPNLVRCTCTTAIVKCVILKQKNIREILKGFQPIKTPWFEKTELHCGATRLISSSTENRWEAARWQQVSHYNSFILIPAHGAVKIAHLRVQQQPERKMSSLYIREPDSPTDESPQTAASSHNHTAGSWWILQHPAAYLEADFTARYASLWIPFPEVTSRNLHRDRLIIRLTNVFHRYSHLWFFNIGSYCHLLGLKDIT